MTYKETPFLRVTSGLFGILSCGMALAVACECLAQLFSILASPAWALTSSHVEPGGSRTIALALEKQPVSSACSSLRLQYVGLLPFKPLLLLLLCVG